MTHLLEESRPGRPARPGLVNLGVWEVPGSQVRDPRAQFVSAQTAAVDRAAVAAFDARIDDRQLLSALRSGDEDAFAVLVRRHHATMVRVAFRYVGSARLAEEVAQDAWLALLRGLDRFQERSTLKVWLFAIVTNLAKDRGVREARSLPFPTLGDEIGVDEDDPERKLIERETRAALVAAIGSLPRRQRIVITMRDVYGLSGREVCDLLQVSPENQRLLLHRARRGVRERLSGAQTAPARSRVASRAP
jgi:RNA polymerase sigma-70 factor, ECF subfamily